MNNEQAMNIIVSVCEKSVQKGVFTLAEAHLVLNALETLGVKLPQVNQISNDDEVEVVEEKETKKK
tara:strand:- start:4390 stop:4587 length:198 start_codon:yes stop_codon:yes gene_type:complete